MAGLNIPGVSDPYGTNQTVEKLMQIERIPLTREQETLDGYKAQKDAWRDVNRLLSSLRDSTKTLYSFENPFNNFVYTNKKDSCIAIINRSGVHSANKKGNKISLTLLNGSAYCAHPVGENISTIPDLTRFVNYIEQGVHDFEFRVVFCIHSFISKYSSYFINSFKSTNKKFL